MGIKPTLELNANEMTGNSPVFSPRLNQLPIAPPQPMVTVPAPMPTPMTIWGAKRQSNYLKAIEELTHAQSSYLRSRAECAKSFVAAARAANEVAELPEICANDTEVRRLNRQADHIEARMRVEQARYGLYATLDEVDKLRKPRMKKVQRNNAAAIDALLKAKVDMEALGEDTSELEHTISGLQRS